MIRICLVLICIVCNNISVHIHTRYVYIVNASTGLSCINDSTQEYEAFLLELPLYKRSCRGTTFKILASSCDNKQN